MSRVVLFFSVPLAPAHPSHIQPLFLLRPFPKVLDEPVQLEPRLPVAESLECFWPDLLLKLRIDGRPLLLLRTMEPEVYLDHVHRLYHFYQPTDRAADRRVQYARLALSLGEPRKALVEDVIQTVQCLKLDDSLAGLV